MGLGGPAEPEEADGQQHGAGDEDGGAELRAADVVVAGLEAAVGEVVDARGELGAAGEAERERDVVQPPDLDALVVVLGRGVEAGEGGKDEVGEAVEVGHVDGEGDDDGLRGHHDEGARDRLLQFLEAGVGVAGRVDAVGGVARLLAEALRLFRQELRGVGLAEEEEAEALDGEGEDAGGVEDPAPGDLGGDEGARDGPDGGAEHGRQRVRGDGAAALVGGPAVGEDAAADGQWGGAAQPGEEAAHEHLWPVLREAAAEVEEEVPEVRELEDGDAAVYLGQGAEDERSDGIGEDEDGEHQRLLDGALNVQVPAHDVDGRRHDGRRDGGEEGEERDCEGGGPFPADCPVLGVLRVGRSVEGDFFARGEVFARGGRFRELFLGFVWDGR